MDRIRKDRDPMERQKFIPTTETKTYEIGVDEESSSTKSILLVEDETMYAELLKEYLETFDYCVSVAEDGVQGLKKVMEKNFDLVICDLLMPNLPGDMFYIAVQKVKPHLCQRFIFMTGHKGDKKIDEFIRKVRGVMLWKPFHPHELLETIRYVLKKTRGE